MLLVGRMCGKVKKKKEVSLITSKYLLGRGDELFLLIFTPTKRKKITSSHHHTVRPIQSTFRKTRNYKAVFILLFNIFTPWCRVLLQKLTGSQLVKKFPTFHGTRRFITPLTSVRHLSLSWASTIQSIYPHPTSWRSILILSTHLRLGLPSGLLPSGFPTKTLYTPLSSPIRATCHDSTVVIYCRDRIRKYVMKGT